MGAMLASGSCIGFEIACDTLLKGLGVTVVGFVLFVGCVLLLLSAIFGRTMGYLVLAVGFFGWMFLLSALWAFGFWSQGLDTPVDLGPRGAEPAWTIEAAGIEPDVTRDAFATYPSGELWREPGDSDADRGDVTSVSSAVKAYLAEEANLEAGYAEGDPAGFTVNDFQVDAVRFAMEDDTQLAAVRAFPASGGPVVTVFLHFDTGSVNMYSWIFMIASLIGLAVHLPFLDRAERKRKDILTGGSAPEWYGPA